MNEKSFNQKFVTHDTLFENEKYEAWIIMKEVKKQNLIWQVFISA